MRSARPSAAACANWKKRIRCNFCTRAQHRCFKKWTAWRPRMTIARPGEFWQTDLGMQAKVRPCLVLTPPPRDDELAVATVVAHTTALRSNRWEVEIQKPFLQKGVFDVQRIATVATVK